MEAGQYLLIEGREVPEPEPAVVEYLRDGCPLVRVDLEHPPHQVLQKAEWRGRWNAGMLLLILPTDSVQR